MDKANKGKLDTNKLKAFNIGAMGVGKRQLSKREQEEYRKRLDKEEAAAVFHDFVASFEDVGKGQKVWVKGGITHPEKGEPKQDKGTRLYRPTSRLSDSQESPTARQMRDEDEDKKAAMKRKDEQKKKSNLELFKEELKMIQEERQERHRIKRGLKDPGPMSTSPSLRGASSLSLDPADMNSGVMLGVPGDVRAPFNYDQLDDSTTNIYVGNINPKMTEIQLCEVFGKYGPLASIKIMWPRSEEERSRGRNCGFVAFMNRKDGERALNSLKGRDIFGFEMKLGWGKAVPIPPHPVYIPPALADLTMPPPPSGLPFNAQPRKTHPKKYGNMGPQSQIPPETPGELEKTLASAVVKVVMPTERLHLCLLHRMVEFVVREGPMFEAMIMNRELNNPQFRFLFDNQSIAHVYYRWRLFSLLQGDSPYKWRTDEFRMFKGGSYWRPPPMNPYTSGMPEELVSVADDGPTKGQLTDSQRDRLEDMLRELTPEKNKVGDVMVWCLDHADSAEEIVDCISEALSILQTPIPKKLARLFLVCDILYNSSAKVPNASFFRRNFQNKLKDIFKDIHEAYINIDGRLKAEQFKQKVMQCFRAWEDWAVYPNEFLISLQNIFLGLVVNRPEPVEEEPPATVNEFDGVPLVDTNGTPNEGITLKPELDGKPLVEDYDGDPIEEFDGDPQDKSLEDEKDNVSKFIQSKWETVDQSELESQAMTTSKWDLLDPGSDSEKEGETSKLGESMDQDEDVDGLPFMDDDDDDVKNPTVPLTPRATPGKHSPSPSALTPSSKDINPLDYYMGKPVQSASKIDTGMSEERRSKLREIELKVVKYQDEVEAGKRSRKAGMTLAAQAEYYRKKLLHKETKRTEKAEKEEKRREREQRERERERERRPQLVDVSSSSSESETESLSSRRSYQSRNYSPLHRSRSGTPKRRKISRSPKRRHSRSRSRSPRPRAALRPVSRSPPPRHKHKHKKKRRD